MVILDPSAVPTARSVCPCSEAVVATMISGRLVPILTTVMPMISGGIPNIRHRMEAA